MFDSTFLPKANLEFVIIADTHYMLESKMVEFPSRRKQSARTGRTLQLIRTLDPEFVVHMGDVVQEYPETQRYHRAIVEAHQQIEQAGLKPYYVAGNQDIGDKPDPTMTTRWVTPSSLAAFHDLYGHSWYSWDQSNLHFVVLNSQLLNTSLPEARQQRQWLEADLSAHADRRIFFFLHLGLFLKEEHEPSLGHYDNIDEPDRSWLIGLIRQYRMELVFSAHSHFSFFNRIDQTRYYNTVSSSFTRPGFSELFAGSAPPEQGRDDAQKLGIYLVRVLDEGTSVQLIRTHGQTEPIDPASSSQFLISRISRDLPQSPLGITLRHPLSNTVDVPVAWPSIIRQQVRNDYPLLSCIELGIQQVRAPAPDLSDPLQRQRLGYLRDEGVQIVGSWLWSDQVDLVEEVNAHHDLLSGVEIQLLGTLCPDKTCCQQIQRYEVQGDLPLSLSTVIPNERIPGKQHLRTRWSYRLDELAMLNQFLAEQATRVDRVLCRVDTDTSPWETMTQLHHLPPFSHIGTIDWTVEFATVDQLAQVVRGAEAIFAVAGLPGSRLFFEPLRDLDRTMDVTHGLLDRLCNPRPVFNVVRCLNTILFSTAENWQPIPALPTEGARTLGLKGESTTLWLFVPEQEGQPFRVKRMQDTGHRSEKTNAIKLFDLEQGTSQVLCAEPDWSSGATLIDFDSILRLKEN